MTHILMGTYLLLKKPSVYTVNHKFLSATPLISAPTLHIVPDTEAAQYFLVESVNENGWKISVYLLT